jgi:fucose permease
MRGTFRLDLDAVGALLVSGTIGYFLVSGLSGRIVGRREVAPILAISLALFGAGLFMFAAAPVWWVVVASGFVTGVAGGLLDATLNIYFAAHYGARLMNWLHACFGLGATIGPLVMTLSLSQTGSWRAGYYAAGALEFVVFAMIVATRAQWGVARPSLDDTPPPARARDTFRLPGVWIGVGLFLCYTGLEMSVGQWAYSLFTEVRQVRAETAGLWVSVFWGTFTVGRIFFGGLGDALPSKTILRICLAGAALFCGLWTWNPAPVSGVLAVAGIGFTIAPVFALMTVSTQERLGPEHAPHAIGFQVAAASIGFGILPAIAGVLAKRAGLEAVPIFALCLALAMVVLFEAVLRYGTHRRTAESPPVAVGSSIEG